VSCTSDAYVGRFAYQSLNRRAVAEIQSNINKPSERNEVSLMFHAKDDKERIATWKLDLDRILHAFNVGSIISVWLSLTTHLQTELVMNTHVIASDTHHGIVNTQTMVSDTHYNILKNQEGTDDQLRLVSDIRNAFRRQMDKRSPLSRLKQG